MANQSGPTSTLGKLASCMNHFKHGGTSESLFIKGEDPQDFFALLENAFEQYQPAFDQDAILVTRSVRANWILMRRERTADAYEAALHARKPEPTYWVPIDLHELNLFDRYKTQAARAFTRALKDLQLLQKMARDDQRWQPQLERQKQKLVSEPSTAAFLESLADCKKEIRVDEQNGPHIPQTVFAAFDEDGATIAFEASPKNETVRRLISTAGQNPTPPTQVIRTYCLKGLIPGEYEWLITEDGQRHLDYQEIHKPLTFDEWHTLAANE